MSDLSHHLSGDAQVQQRHSKYPRFADAKHRSDGNTHGCVQTELAEEYTSPAASSPGLHQGHFSHVHSLSFALRIFEHLHLICMKTCAIPASLALLDSAHPSSPPRLGLTSLGGWRDLLGRAVPHRCARQLYSN